MPEGLGELEIVAEVEAVEDTDKEGRALVLPQADWEEVDENDASDGDSVTRDESDADVDTDAAGESDAFGDVDGLLLDTSVHEESEDSLGLPVDANVNVKRAD